MSIKPEYLIPYLPYSLKVIMEGKKTNVAWMSTKNIAVIIPDGIGEYKKIAWKYAHHNIKPILRPLSDLSKEINDTGLTIVFGAVSGGFHSAEPDYKPRLQASCLNIEQNIKTNNVSWGLMKQLLRLHFDVFGLIEKDLAVDINTLKL